ncbi:MAG: hypothetical protein L0G99_08340, partial [Propionibacteriales bacterium]|nr:hypothetical protein [Propionibacteriales bacterium]
AANLIQAAADEDGHIIFGTVIDDALGDEVRVTVIAAGFDGGMPPRRQQGVSRQAPRQSDNRQSDNRQSGGAEGRPGQAGQAGQAREGAQVAEGGRGQSGTSPSTQGSSERTGEPGATSERSSQSETGRSAAVPSTGSAPDDVATRADSPSPFGGSTQSQAGRFDGGRSEAETRGQGQTRRTDQGDRPRPADDDDLDIPDFLK